MYSKNSINRCAISKRELQEDDDVVHFPYYDAVPGDPEFICCENIALRSEFEKWHFKESVTKKVRGFWVQTYSERKYSLILAENENFLITKSTVEDWIRIIFLNHVFHVNFRWNTWRQFADTMLTAEQGDVNSMEEDIFHWQADSINRTLKLQNRNRDDWRDTIVMPISEWLNLRELVSTIK